MTHYLIRCQTAAQVQAIADANHLTPTRNPYAASVELGGGSSTSGRRHE